MSGLNLENNKSRQQKRGSMNRAFYIQHRRQGVDLYRDHSRWSLRRIEMRVVIDLPIIHERLGSSFAPCTTSPPPPQSAFKKSLRNDPKRWYFCLFIYLFFFFILKIPTSGCHIQSSSLLIPPHSWPPPDDVNYIRNAETIDYHAIPNTC